MLVSLYAGMLISLHCQLFVICDVDEDDADCEDDKGKVDVDKSALSNVVDLENEEEENEDEDEDEDIHNRWRCDFCVGSKFLTPKSILMLSNVLRRVVFN